MGRAAVRETLTMAADGERRPTSPRWGRKAHGVSPPVFLASAIIILAVAAFAVTQRETANAVFPALLHGVTTRFGWFYLLAVAGFLSFVGWLAVSPFGRIRLGADDSTPEFGQLPWFAMLFSAGMGIGLVFFGVAEPISHYVAPPSGGPGGTTEAARRAMIVTFFHWGVHAWAIYAVAGLALAYFAFRRGLPLSIRSALFPLIGARIHGPIGHAIDVFAVISTLFGVATSLGLGVMQVNAGLSHLFGAPMSLPVQLWLIAGITAIATLSVVTGLDRGIRRISELNLGLAFALLLFVLATGPTLHLLNAFTQNLGAYLSDFVRLTFRNFAYEPNEWIASWTLFYWGWWIAWAPFVGMFIARISRGRTIREFILGVLLAPAGFTFIWLTVFGNTALWLERTGAAPLAETVDQSARGFVRSARAIAAGRHYGRFGYAAGGHVFRHLVRQRIAGDRHDDLWRRSGSAAVDTGVLGAYRGRRGRRLAGGGRLDGFAGRFPDLRFAVHGDHDPHLHRPLAWAAG